MRLLTGCLRTSDVLPDSRLQAKLAAVEAPLELAKAKLAAVEAASNPLTQMLDVTEAEAEAYLNDGDAAVAASGAAPPSAMITAAEVLAAEAPAPTSASAVVDAAGASPALPAPAELVEIKDDHHHHHPTAEALAEPRPIAEAVSEPSAALGSVSQQPASPAASPAATPAATPCRPGADAEGDPALASAASAMPNTSAGPARPLSVDDGAAAFGKKKKKQDKPSPSSSPESPADGASKKSKKKKKKDFTGTGDRPKKDKGKGGALVETSRPADADPHADADTVVDPHADPHAGADAAAASIGAAAVGAVADPAATDGGSGAASAMSASPPTNVEEAAAKATPNKPGWVPRQQSPNGGKTEEFGFAYDADRLCKFAANVAFEHPGVNASMERDSDAELKNGAKAARIHGKVVAWRASAQQHMAFTLDLARCLADNCDIFAMDSADCTNVHTGSPVARQAVVRQLRHLFGDHFSRIYQLYATPTRAV